MKSNFKLLSILFLFITAMNAQNKAEIKLNFGMASSKPLYDLATVAGEGHQLQPHLNLEGKVIRIPFGKDADLGLKITGVAGMEWANVLSNDATTEVNISMPHLKTRVYPLTYNGDVFEVIEKQDIEKLPFGIDLLWGFTQLIAINSLHFDYGVSFATLEEVAFIDEYNFEPETVKRTMTYTGWGLQPQIYHSDSGKWIWNAFFDFGKYKWKNANGGTSGLKTNNLGFGVRYDF